MITSSSTTRLYRGRAPRQFYVLPHMIQSWETMTSISAGHIILTPTQPVGSGRPQRGSNPGPPDQESRALPTELPRPLLAKSEIKMSMGQTCEKDSYIGHPFTLNIVVEKSKKRENLFCRSDHYHIWTAHIRKEIFYVGLPPLYH